MILETCKRDPEEIALSGCTPVPLGSYLIALGIFRIVAEQADEDARADWSRRGFRLHSRLTAEDLERFLLERYVPSPVLSPWNGGSGFFFREGKTSDKDPATGKLTKTGIHSEATGATRALEEISAASSPRFAAFRRAAQSSRQELSLRGLQSAPEGSAKAAVVRSLRSHAPDDLLPWLDASALVVAASSRRGRELRVDYPPLLGSGGNDGNLDFSTTVVQALLSLIDPSTGQPTGSSRDCLHAALFGQPMSVASHVPVSQYDPGAAGGPNSGAGFSGSSSSSPWETVLGFEGTLVVSAAAARRMASTSGSFPFTVARQGSVGAGSGNVAPADEKTSRGEFWAPVWDRPISYPELLLLFREGRAVVGSRRATNALDFAQSIAQLGVDRGISSFQRFGFEQRNGNMYLGVPLASFKVRRNANADLISDVESRGWLQRARDVTRFGLKGDGTLDRSREAPASLASIGRYLDDTLFKLASESGPDVVQRTIEALGRLVLAASVRPSLRAALPPPPRLGRQWAEAADDGSVEFALAASLASLDASAEGFELPFRRHLVPLYRNKGRYVWEKPTTEAEVLAVWTGRDLVRDLAEVLERRLLEGQRRRFIRRGTDGDTAELPLRGYRVVSPAAVSAFLSEDVDLDRIAALIPALAWIRVPGARSSVSVQADNPLPLAYSMLKPLFWPEGAGPEPANRKLLDPLPLVRVLRSDRLDDAHALAVRMARGAGLATPFARASMAALGADRLAASLLFPISSTENDALVAIGYPDLKKSGGRPQ